MVSMRMCLTGIALLSAGLALVAGQVELPEIKRPSLDSPRYLTHVATDKPIYRSGETVYVRAVVLHAMTRKPMASEPAVAASLEILGPKGESVTNGYAIVENGVAGLSWTIPDGQSGGEYTARVRLPVAGDPPADRKFDIRAYRPPQLKSQIVFLRDAYGAGDRVSASLKVERAAGGAADGAKVTAIARIDGLEVWRGETRVSSAGTARVEFALPPTIAAGDGSLAFIIDDGGVSETAAKTIPIVLQTVALSLYPESGELVDGVPTRIYFEARTPTGKPADIEGEVVDSRGEVVATFRSTHEGRGRFSLTPRATERYALRLSAPAGIVTTWELPAVRTDGAVVAALEEKAPAGGPLKLRIAAAKSGKLSLSIWQRGVELASQWVSVRGGESRTLEIPLPDWVAGVVTATVRDEHGVPLAERLLFRGPPDDLRITVRPDRESYIPGERVELTLKATDAAGNPVSAMVGVSVTDDRTLEMIDNREKSPRLPVMVLLESDVRELADAKIYLDEQDPKSAEAVDLLLGTQGWRRFAFVKPDEFVQLHNDAARRVLGLRMPMQPTAARFDALAFGDALGEAGGRAGMLLRDEARPPAAAVLNLQFGAHAELKDAPVIVKAEEFAQLRVNRDRDLSIAGGRGFRGGGFNEAASRAQLPLTSVRVYAHDIRPNRDPAERIDFTETVFWNAGVRTDAKTGLAKVKFALSDSITTFRAMADAFGEQGGLASATAAIQSIQPFYSEPKLPLEVTAGDIVQMPIELVNNRAESLENVKLAISATGDVRFEPLNAFEVAGRSRVRRNAQFTIGNFAGESEISIGATSASISDRVTRKLRVVPRGFPTEVALGGVVEPDGSSAHTIIIPADLVRGSSKTTCELYPSPLANLTQALERLLQEPHGCFEQTSSTTYPLVMAQQYFLTQSGIDPALIEKSSGLLDRGYQRLIGFECKTAGFEWFGADPGHEALTAFGLMQFSDMAKVRQVDAKLLERTRNWLKSKRDGKGNFTQGQRTLHTWLPDPVLQTGYILWAALEAGETGFDREIVWLRDAAGESKDPYIWALAANVMSLAGDSAAADKFLERLSSAQTKSGPLTGAMEGAKTSIVGSGGESLMIETTALSLIAWMRASGTVGPKRYTDKVERGVRYIAECCKGGRFGSTQATVLALRAIIEYDRHFARPQRAGAVQLVIDGQAVGAPVSFDENSRGVIRLPDFSELVASGERKLELRMQGGSRMPYSIAIRVHREQPPNSQQCKLGLTTELTGGTVADGVQILREGEIAEVQIRVTNRSDESLPSPIAIIGLPGGCEPRHDQLKELVKAGRIDAYEVIGRDVVLYWRAMKARETTTLPISLIAAIPGQYSGPASRAYQYYTDEHKTWQPGLQVRISPRGS